jgi:DNA-binding CsgD family transcriptional regulator
LVTKLLSTTFPVLIQVLEYLNDIGNEWSVLFVKTIEIMPFTTIRNCFRCGKEFQSGSGNRICSDCGRPKEQRKTALNPNLSFREKQVVTLVCKAKLNKEIAYELHLTEGTIKEYLNRIFRKLGVSNRTELAVWALTQPSQRIIQEYVA